VLPDLASWQYFHFLRPGWALIFLPYLVIWLMLRRNAVQGDMFDGIIAPHLLEHLRVTRFKSRWMNPRTFTTVLMALFMVILMGPSWRQQPSPLSQDEAALVILLDVSASMSQRDVQPSRLQRARQKIADLLALRPDKRTALIVYAGSAHTVLSLTADQAILQQYLAALEPGIMPRPGKFPEYALIEVDDVLGQSTAPATLVLLGDGLGADSNQAFANYFGRNQHQLLVWGIGTEKTDKGLIPLERNAMEQLASDSGGRYIELTINDSDVAGINRRIDNHFVIREDSALPWLDSGYALVFPALAIFLMWFRKGWTLTWGWLMLPLLLAQSPAPVFAAEEGIATDASSASHRNAGHWDASRWFADLWLTPDQQGRILLQRGRYREAATRFDTLNWKALAYYYGEEFMLAAEYFSRSDTDDALFNEANARAHARDYVRSRNRYDRLLARTPDYPGAAQNRDIVQAIIEETNRLSESQQEESGVSGEDKELGGDEAIPADGADEISFEQAELIQLTAEDILQDQATSDMWLRSVQKNPADFLANKFSMQLQYREQPVEPQP
jgi:Ca-activated chloride channel family protein